MNIIGLDELVFDVADLDACARCLLDYGLRPIPTEEAGERFEALDGTAVVIRRAKAAGASGPTPPSTLVETVYGVRDEVALENVASELQRDRGVARATDGSLSCLDDTGFALRFRRTSRRPYRAAADLTNAPGAEPQRGPNTLGVTADLPALPRTLSHVVLFVPDAKRAERFYHRLGFRVTDRFTGSGAFLRPAGTQEHHTLFLIEAPAFMRGVEHFAFHVGSATEVLLAGTRFEAKGYRTFWGPGRHVFGSNWFWYFDSPLGCHLEYDADMDLHNDAWIPRELPISEDNSQIFLFNSRAKWVPAGGPE